MTKLDIVPNSLKAWIDRQPGVDKVPKLFVTVDVRAEIDWQIALIPAIPPGINPRIKLLKFDVQLPTGRHNNTVAQRTVRYEEPVGLGGDYTDVTIQNDGGNISTKVETVS